MGIKRFHFNDLMSGHFGYIELPIPIYHPSHVSELKRMLSLLCLKCLKMKKNKVIPEFFSNFVKVVVVAGYNFYFLLDTGKGEYNLLYSFVIWAFLLF